MKVRKWDKAVSQILGTTLLLLISLAVLSSVYMYVLSYPMPNSPPIVDIVGSLEGENITLLHRGGESLELDTQLFLNIGNTTHSITVGDCLDDKYKNDSLWNIGEQLVYQAGDTTGVKVGATVSESESESILYQVWFKEIYSETFEFIVEIGKEGNFITIPGTLNIIIVYTDQNNDGWVQTIELTANGGIKALLDSFEFDPNFCNNPNLIHVAGNIYALCYRGQGSNGTLITLQIAQNGNINETIQDVLVFDSDDCFDPDIIHLADNIYTIAYQGFDEDGFLKTIEILPDGNITSVKDTLEFDTDQTKEPDLNHIIGDIYAIVYSGVNEDGFLVTVEIAANGSITDPVNDTLEFDLNTGKSTDIVHVSGDIYAIPYEGEGKDGTLKTVEIWENGDINNTVIETAEFDAVKGQEPEIIHVSGNIFAIAYSGDGLVGNVITVDIADDGSIVDPFVDGFEFSEYATSPRIIRITENYFAISWRGSGNQGALTTVHIANDGEIL